MGWLAAFSRFRFHNEVLGTVAALVVAWLAVAIGGKIIDAHRDDIRDHYRARQALNTFVLVACAVAVLVLWVIPLQHSGFRLGTFLGLIGAGLAVALREPLLSIAGRVTIFAGHMFSVGDRIEIDKMSGDVIDIGFFYTRMMEIGNWIGGDQYSGRIIQFANAKIFGTAVMNYTRNFAYIWDEVNLPITYESNVAAATKILLDVGSRYTQEFLQGAERQLQHMKRYFLVPNFELQPQVYTKVTSNYVGLTMRYLVDPKKRRVASSFIYHEVFSQIQQRDDVSIGSDTMTVTVQAAKGQEFKMPARGEDSAELRAASGNQSSRQPVPAKTQEPPTAGTLTDDGATGATDALPGDKHAGGENKKAA